MNECPLREKLPLIHEYTCLGRVEGNGICADFRMEACVTLKAFKALRHFSPTETLRLLKQ